ncbi:MAG: hypothetical protein HZA81_03330 [Candidatus Taylorbacteria bacterium]|nr:hypothetical protein [Candidatus Taylorbacteria bacterium]
MDIISHGLWGGVAFGRKNKRAFWWSALFGISPDLFSFGIFTVANLFERGGFGRPELSSIPGYVSSLYDLTHSLVVFATVFALAWAVFRKPFWPMLAWPLHIAVDIFTHSTEFFPTPFLWPLSIYRFDGVSWATPSIFFTNLALIAFAYAMWGIQRLRRRRAVREEISRRS